MGIRKFNPVTPGTRWRTVASFEELTTDRPEKSLTRPLSKSGGRNNTGRVTSRHRGGGHKRRYRVIDFKRDKFGITGNVATIEYDPNRSARIALITYVDGEKRYILAPDGLKVGDTVMSGPAADPKVGNALPLAQIPVGSKIHNIELRPGKGGQMARSAGTSAQLMGRDGDRVQIKLPSGEVRTVLGRNLATLGEVSNHDHENISLGKAGVSRWLGIRPWSRGVAKNPVDHPMGGGEGKSSGGRHPVSPWGMPAKGYKTRKKRNPSNKFIITRRTK